MITYTERVDDIPLLIAEFKKSDLIALLDECFPDHGNWGGASGGQVIVGFLTYVLSRSDHRLSHVETWAAQRIHTLKCCFNNAALDSKDFTDDKLGSLLDRYADDDKWDVFEPAHNRRLINVYNLALASEAIRLDAFITQSHRESTADFQRGHSKQHRADLPQLKTMVATLDPLAMPLYSLTVSGNTSDDVLYLPVLEKLVEGLQLHNQLFVGDSKMGSLDIRTFLQYNEQYYLMPLSKTQCSNKKLSQYLAEQPTELTQIATTDKDGNSIVKAKAFEVKQQMEAADKTFCWEERRVIVYSFAYATSQKKVFEDRLIKAQKALDVILKPAQGRKKMKTEAEVQAAVTKILDKYKVGNFIQVNINQRVETKAVRKYKDKPQSTKKIIHFELEITINETAKQAHLQRLGWRAYACNAPEEQLDTQQIVECYRNEYKIEHKFDELLHKLTALMPVYLKKPNRIKALIRLLLLALKYVSIIQHQVRTELKTSQQTLKELYAGNPARKTQQPTTMMLLTAFKNIHLTIAEVENKRYVKITELTANQLKILALLKIPNEVYLQMNKLLFSHFDFNET